MKVVVGCLYHETNTFNPILTDIHDFVLAEGEDAASRLAGTEVFRENGIEVIPSIYATALSSGIVKKEAYRYFADKLISTLKQHPDIDGIWLHLHGAMVVEEVGSGELALVKEIRECVGPDVPISLTMDIHGNIALDYYKYINIVKAYRTVPHVDQLEVEKETAQLLVDCLKNNTKIKPAFTRLPMIIPGEKALGKSEPLRSIFEKLYEVEKIKGISTASFFICHAWSDSENTASSIFVIPESEEYEELAEKVKDELAHYVFSKRHEFDFDAVVLDPEESVDRALNEQLKPVFISDSGDNTTAGAIGMNTLLLDLFKNKDLGRKKVLISAIHDPMAYEKLKSCSIGESVTVEVGTKIDENSQPVLLEGTLTSKGDLLGYLNATSDKVGDVCTVSVGSLDVVVANRGESFITLNHFTRAGLNWEDYDIIVVKQGYLFNELSAVSKLDILSMTPGATYQRIENIDYRHVPRPLFPLDTE
ncbi:M81 family metallopeptidase [Paenibacillus humicus]|uniref:M81 family metallopeptidase n=1 Tax=Paenibacillus humicus TaxID=412861 RepID=UPI003D2B8A38